MRWHFDICLSLAGLWLTGMLVLLQMWLIIFPQVIASVLIFHVMMIGLLAIKESFASILVSCWQDLSFEECCGDIVIHLQEGQMLHVIFHIL